MLIMNFYNTHTGNKMTLTLAETENIIALTITDLSASRFQSLALMYIKTIDKFALNYKLNSSVIIIHEAYQETLIKKLCIEEWLKSFVRVLTSKRLNSIERDSVLTEMYYSVIYNLNRVMGDDKWVQSYI